MSKRTQAESEEKNKAPSNVLVIELFGILEKDVLNVLLRVCTKEKINLEYSIY